MTLDDFSRDGQSQASASNVTVGEAFDAEELVEDVLQSFRRNANAAVPDAHLQTALRFFARRDGDLAALRAVLAGVRQEIAEHLLDAIGLGHGHRQVFWHIQDDWMLRIVRGKISRKLQQIGKVSGTRLDDGRAGLHALQVEQVVDEL